MRFFRQTEFDGLHEGYMAAADAPLKFVSAIIAGLGIAGSVIGANASNNAAQVQATASNDAARLQYQATQDALKLQREQWDYAKQISQPWLTTGSSGLGALAHLLGLPQQQQAAQPNAPGGAPGVIGAGGGGMPGGGAPGTGELPPVTHPLAGGAGGGPAGFTGSTLGPVGAGGGGFSWPGESRWWDGYPGMPIDIMYSGEAPRRTGDGAPTPTGTPGAGDVGPRFDDTGRPLPGSDPTTSTDYGHLGGFGSLLAPWDEKFVAPTGKDLFEDPSYQFRLREGIKALENSAAARGSILTGQTAKDISQWAQELASTEYGNVYGRRLGEYQQRYNIGQNDQANTFNRLAAIAGIGQTAATNLTSTGQNNANQSGNIILTGAANQGGYIQNAGNARASGYVGAGNAWQGGLNNLGYVLGRRYP